jgi:hypothetical protein
MDKHSSLLQKSVNYRQKKFYNIGPWSPYSLYLIYLTFSLSTLKVKNCLGRKFTILSSRCRLQLQHIVLCNRLCE